MTNLENDLAMMVRWLSRRLRKHHGDMEYATIADDFLSRKGLVGNPVRGASPVTRIEDRNAFLYGREGLKKMVMPEQEAIRFMQESERKVMADDSTGWFVIFYHHPGGRMLLFDATNDRPIRP